jgi:pimeloyl-ACP methyl ester carboxylesterase
MTNSNEIVEVVLVHGGWSDGSCWSKVILELRKQDVCSSAAQLPLSGFSDDVVALCRHIESRSASEVILIGHSYGGAIITEVASRYESIRGLVYVAASAPVAGQSFGDFMQQHPSPVSFTLTPDRQGFLWADQDMFAQVLAQDLSAEECELLHAVQKPVAATILGDAISSEGWRHRPSWYVVADEDRLFAAADQRQLAKQIGAKVTSLASAHFVPRSRPTELTEVICSVIRSTATTI